MARLYLQEYDTPDELYDGLVRLFGENTSGPSRWVKLEHDGAELTFFARNDHALELYAGERGVTVADDSDQYREEF